MSQSVLHPAMLELLWLQARGRRRRIWNRFRQPRRLVLSAVAIVLTAAWLGNAALTVWLREAAAVNTLRAMLSLGLVLYAGWHVCRTAFFRPEVPFDWAPEEREQLAAMPLAPRDLVAYHIAAVTATTLLKAGLFTALLLPDLRCWPLALTGIVLAMLLLEFIRMAIEIAVWGMSRRVFRAYRSLVLGGLMLAALSLGKVIVNHEVFNARLDSEHGIRQTISELIVEAHSADVGLAGLPFRPFVELILAEHVDAPTLALVAACLAVVAGLAGAVIGLYSLTLRQIAGREVRDYAALGLLQLAVPSARSAGRVARTNDSALQLARIPHCRGSGPLAWRQWMGARRQWGSLVSAMIAPAVLACIPIFVVADARDAFVATMGTLAFYTFLLLPTAVRFDFRRDLDRLVILKGLPITPAATTIGQIVMPVVIATVFQGVVLSLAAAMRLLPAHYVAVAIVTMAPINLVMFSVDNFIYLLYPYRLQQEGVEIFLRTILIFTGKGLIFAAGLGTIAAWGFTAAALAHSLASWWSHAPSALAVFLLGTFLGATLLAMVTLLGVSRVYNGMNPIEDLPR